MARHPQYAAGGLVAVCGGAHGRRRGAGGLGDAEECRAARRRQVDVKSDLAMALDPVLFARAVGFEPDPWQAEVLRSRAPRILLNCSRQSGKSTVVAILAMWTALYCPGSTTLIVSPTERQSKELFRKALAVYRGLGRPVSPESESALQLELESGSRIIALPGKEASIPSYSPDLLAIDAAPH